MSGQLAGVDTLFLHERGDDYRIAVQRNGERVLHGVLEVKETDAGPRPRRLRVKDGSSEDPRSPDEFLEIARRAERIHVSEQTSTEGRQELGDLFAAYQLSTTVVRTCRWCATKGQYSPLTAETAIDADGESICRACARAELEREATFAGGITGDALDRLEELLGEVQDLDRIVNLLQGDLDPELTKFDEISATVDDVEAVRTDALDLHPDVAAHFTDRFDELLPVQSLSVQHGLLEGRDQLVVSATATGKTLIGELAGLDRVCRGDGKLLFLVPLVALANQKYGQFQDRYGDLVDVTLRVGASRIGGGGPGFDPSADVVVGTYEGIDHALRTGRDLGTIGTVVVDEVHNLGEGDRGHRLDGLISRLHHYCETGGGPTPAASDGGTQWIYLSATVGNPGELARSLDARLIEFEERPVPIERHVTFADNREKVRIENDLVRRAFDTKSSKGYRGQTIVFTNSRRRCHQVARKLDYDAAPYHAGLDNSRRAQVEERFAEQELAAVVTTAALAAGVDFPASQVIFDSLAMGIEWLSVREFHQMLGRAGRPDYHDQGTVYLLVEPDGVYHHGMDRTEDEVAFTLLKGEMEPVVTRYDESAAVAETLANVVVGGRAAKALTERMVGDVPIEHALGKLLEYGFLDGLEPTDLGRAVTRHFLAPDQAFALLEAARAGGDPYDVVADVALRDRENR